MQLNVLNDLAKAMKALDGKKDPENHQFYWKLVFQPLSARVYVNLSDGKPF